MTRRLAVRIVAVMLVALCVTTTAEEGGKGRRGGGMLATAGSFSLSTSNRAGNSEDMELEEALMEGQEDDLGEADEGLPVKVPGGMPAIGGMGTLPDDFDCTDPEASLLYENMPQQLPLFSGTTQTNTSDSAGKPASTVKPPAAPADAAAAAKAKGAAKAAAAAKAHSFQNLWCQRCQEAKAIAKAAKANSTAKAAREGMVMELGEEVAESRKKQGKGGKKKDKKKKGGKAAKEGPAPAPAPAPKAAPAPADKKDGKVAEKDGGKVKKATEAVKSTGVPPFKVNPGACSNSTWGCWGDELQCGVTTYNKGKGKTRLKNCPMMKRQGFSFCRSWQESCPRICLKMPASQLDKTRNDLKEKNPDFAWREKVRPKIPVNCIEASYGYAQETKEAMLPKGANNPTGRGWPSWYGKEDKPPRVNKKGGVCESLDCALPCSGESDRPRLGWTDLFPPPSSTNKWYMPTANPCNVASCSKHSIPGRKTQVRAANKNCILRWGFVRKRYGFIGKLTDGLQRLPSRRWSVKNDIQRIVGYHNATAMSCKQSKTSKKGGEAMLDSARTLGESKTELSKSAKVLRDCKLRGRCPAKFAVDVLEATLCSKNNSKCAQRSVLVNCFVQYRLGVLKTSELNQHFRKKQWPTKIVKCTAEERRMFSMFKDSW